MPRGWDEKLGEDFTDKVQKEVAKDINSFHDNPVKWLQNKGHACSVEKIFDDKEGSDHEGLPAIWSKLYESENPKKQKAIKIDNDTLYVMLVSGILHMAIKPLKETAEKERKCHPIVIAAALVTEDHLKKAENPMKVALKVRAAIRNVWGKRSGALYSEIYEEDIRKTPREFAETLLKKCVSLQETAALIDVTDVEVLTALSEGKFRRVTQDYAFKKLTRDNVFWGTCCNESELLFFLKDCPVRFGCVLLWNIFYFLEVITCGRIKKLEGQRKKLFSPVSCFFADILNYIIMVLIIGIVVMQKGAGIAQESTVELTRQYIQGNISIEDEPRLKNGSTPGITLVELEKNPMSFFGFLLVLCLFSRIITELLQLFERDVFLAVPKKIRGGGIVSHPMLKQIRKRFRIYIHSDMNKIDLILMCILTIALVIDFDYSFFSKAVYGRICTTEACDEELDFSLEARRVIYMINLYSLAVLLSLVRLFYCLFEYVSIIGPMLRSMQLMIKDVIKVLIILVFLSIGFFIPLLTITRTYRSVHTTTKIKSGIVSEDDETFKSMESFHGGIYTMIFSLMDGQLSRADDIYSSRDQSINVFFFIIVIFYFLAVGLLCFNLLIALVTKRYDTTVENKNREWEFSKYQLIMNYLCLEENAAAGKARNDGMPFIFPFTFLYIPPRLLARIFGKKVKDCAINGKRISYSCVEAEEDKESGGAENGGKEATETNDINDLDMMKMLVKREPPKKEEDKSEPDENPAV